MIRMEDVVVHVAPVDREHLPGHALVAFVSAFAVLQETVAYFLDDHLVRIGPVGARLHLTFNLNSKCISGLLLREMLPLSLATAVRVVHNPGGFGFATGGLPYTLTH
jgi:hypothetical protein